MEEYRQTNPLELHVNREIQVELQREALRHSMHAHLNAIYQLCLPQCITSAQPLTLQEQSCLSACYKRSSTGLQSHLHSLLRTTERVEVSTKTDI